ncbi:MAG: dephospho-CoA kinase [Bacteroidales bacterium]|nr:dephospho-CoA kinase [Bacteroidales bacterium]
MSVIVGITGGIGSGKSVVSEVLRAMGHEVYDCDAEARRIMDTDTAIHSRLRSEISPEAVDDAGCINRKHIASIVFADPSRLKALNTIVHGAVMADLRRRAAAVSGVMFFESAILYSSGFCALADKIWEVTAPEELRIKRVMARNNVSRSEVTARMESQRSETAPEGISPRILINDGVAPLLPQIFLALDEL